MMTTVVVGKKIGGVTQLTQQMVTSGARIVLVDASTGEPPKKIITKMVNKDLHIFTDGAAEPSVILNDYAFYSQTVQISGIDSSGAFANYSTTQAGAMELGEVSEAPVAAATPFMSTNVLWGVGILAVAGGVAAAAGGSGSSSTTSATNPAITPTGSSAPTGTTSGPILTIIDDEPNVTANMDGSNTDGTLDANGGDILYTFTFDKAVNDFTVNDIVITMQKTEGTIDFTYTEATDTNGLIFKTFTKVSDTVYTLSVHPQAGYEGKMQVSVLKTAYHDLAGNTGNISSDTLSTQAVDMRAPFPSPLPDTDTHNFGTVNVITPDPEFQRIILTFDEALDQVNQVSPSNFGVMINGAVFAVNAIGVSDNTSGMADNQVFLYLEPVFNARGESFDWRTAGVTVSYTDGATDLTSVIQDLAGNDATSFNDYVNDQLAPNTIITMDDTIISSGDTPTVTFTFSEKVTLSLSDLDLTGANGDVGTLSTADGGKTWTGTFTPAIGIAEDLSNIITLNNTYYDHSGNSGIAAVSNNYVVDTQGPAVVSVAGNNANDTITITFDQLLSPDAASITDFYVTDGSLTADTTDDPAAVNQIVVSGIGVSGSNLILSMSPMASGNWKVIYADAQGPTQYAIQDIYGNDATGFSWSGAVL